MTAETATTPVVEEKITETARPTEAHDEESSSVESDESIIKQTVKETPKKPSGRSRKSAADLESLFDHIVNLIDTSENPSDVTLMNIRETVAKCRVTLTEFASRRKRRSPGAVRRASQRKNKRETEAEPEASVSKPATQQRSVLKNNNNNNILRMRGPPPMFFGGDFWHPPFGPMGDLASPAAMYYESPMFDWRRQGLSRRARDRRDRLVQEKEQAIIRAELRAARTAKDFEKAIEKAKRHGMDYEVQSAKLRLEKLRC